MGVEKLIARDRFSLELIVPEAWQRPVERLGGDRRGPCGWRAQESDQAFDVLGRGGQEELLLNELQPAQQVKALANCFREEWNGTGAKAKRILLPVRHLQEWIEHNVLLLLKQAPFNKRDPQLVPTEGSCVECPKRTGHNKLLFAEVSGNSDACMLCGIWATASLSCWLAAPAPTAWVAAIQPSVLLEPPTGGSFGW